MTDDIPLHHLPSYKAHDIATAAAPDPENALLAKEEAIIRERALDILDGFSSKHKRHAIYLRARFGIVLPVTYTPDEIFLACMHKRLWNSDARRAFVKKCEQPENEFLYSLVHGTNKTQLPEMSYQDIAKMFHMNVQRIISTFRVMKERALGTRPAKIADESEE